MNRSEVLDAQASAIQRLGEMLKAECEQYEKLGQEAAWRGLRIGVICLRAKAQLKHGQFIPWMESVIPNFTRQYINRFMQIADAFLRVKKLSLLDALPLAEPSAKLLTAGSTGAPKVVQMAFEFIGTSSFADLCAKYRVQSAKGGAREAGKKGDYNPEVEAVNAWKELCNALHHHGVERKTWAHLPHAELFAVLEILEPIYQQVKTAVQLAKRGKRG